MTHQKIYRKFTLSIMSLLLVMTVGCKDNKEDQTSQNQEVSAAETEAKATAKPFFKLSLAQWSIHKMIMESGADPLDFASLAAEWGFEGVEYVSQLYKPFWEEYDTKQEGINALVEFLNEAATENGVENLIIMIDGEGDLAVNDEQARNEAVENHKIWVDAAAAMGCHSIRINLFGSFDEQEWKANSIDAMTKLAGYAKDKNVNIIVENHGWLSSNAPLLMEVINEVGMENAGTLPDFGNFCVKRKDYEKWGECVEEYPDIYEGVKLMMPEAKAVSAKSYDFDQYGNETKIDYAKMISIVKDAGYTGYIGVEYEGSRLSEREGIMATKELLLKVGQN